MDPHANANANANANDEASSNAGVQDLGPMVMDAFQVVGQIVDKLDMQGLTISVAPVAPVAAPAALAASAAPVVIRVDRLPAPLAHGQPRPITREDALDQFLYFQRYLVVHDLQPEQMPPLYHLLVKEARLWVANLGGSSELQIPPSEEFLTRHPGEPGSQRAQTKFKDPPPLTREWVEEVKAVPSCIAVAVKRIFL